MLDARIIVAFGAAADAAAGDAVLAGQFAIASHVAGCACCASRSPAAEALGRLFQQRARGEVAFFRRVLVVTDAAGEQAVRQTLRSDPLASAWFRPG